MADLTALADVGHFWGGDVFTSASGDLQKVSRADRSKQRVLRRLLTNPGDLLFHPGYGAGLPRRVGSNLDVDEITAVIRQQMGLEVSVAQTPPPVISVSEITNGVQVSVDYTVLPDRQPVSLAFSVEA